ncbi:MAG: cupin domain-containing protein [Rhizomicrobium sp.]
MPSRPSFIRHWRDAEYATVPNPTDVDQTAAYSNLSEDTGLSRLGVGHLRLPPGARSGPPAAMRDEEEFAFVLKGAPDLWFDGYTYRLREGHGVALHSGTGMANAFLNNTDEEVHLFMFKEGSRFATKYFFPTDPVATGRAEGLKKLWANPPRRKLGPHDGFSDAKRGRPAPPGAAKKKPPAFVWHWKDILDKDVGGYPGSTEKHGIDARFGRLARFSRLGVHLEVLPGGRRTSWPHAERDEEEWVYIVSGALDCWLDGRIHKMAEGDFVGFEAGTGITHVCINNGDEDAILIVGSEAARNRNQFWYPMHPHRDKEIKELFWADHPKIRLGPHDGLPDALRERVPPKARRSAVAANAAAFKLRPKRGR